MTREPQSTTQTRPVRAHRNSMFFKKLAANPPAPGHAELQQTTCSRKLPVLHKTIKRLHA
jgi:hypothetical protein